MAKITKPPKESNKATKTKKSSEKAMLEPVSDESKNSCKILPFEESCSFCRTPSKEAWRLIAGPLNVYICDRCVATCIAILLEDGEAEGCLDWKNRVKDLLDNPPKFNLEKRN